MVLSFSRNRKARHGNSNIICISNFINYYFNKTKDFSNVNIFSYYIINSIYFSIKSKWFGGPTLLYFLFI